MLVTITGKKDSGSDIAKIKYEITRNGESYITDTPGGSTVTRLLEEDGSYTIKAWAIDEAGRQSLRYDEKTVSKDGNAPTGVTLTVKSGYAKTINVIATAQDNGGSGIYQYKFKIKKSIDGTYEDRDTITVDNDETCKYTYKGLEAEVSYDIMVEVYDKAGNMKTATTDQAFTTKEWVAKVRMLC